MRVHGDNGEEAHPSKFCYISNGTRQCCVQAERRRQRTLKSLAVNDLVKVTRISHNHLVLLSQDFIFDTCTEYYYYLVKARLIHIAKYFRIVGPVMNILKGQVYSEYYALQ